MSSKTQITRGKVMSGRVAGRTLLQITGLDGEVLGNIELLLPYGHVANPLPASDVLLLQANGVRSHTVAMGGDNTADRVADLQPGEAGLSIGGRSVILRVDGTEVIDPVEIVLTAPVVMINGNGTLSGNLFVSGNITGTG